MLRLNSASVAIAAALVAAPVVANGRFPRAQQVEEVPTDPTRIVLRTTFGVLLSGDSGSTWRYLCENAIGYGGSEDPSMALTGDGSMVNGLFGGLSVSHDHGCTWTLAGAELAAQFVADVTVERADPSVALVLVSQPESGGFSNQIWESRDDARTWSKLGAPLGDDALAFTIDPAPSDATIVYATGVAGATSVDGAPPMPKGVLFRSTDRGATWVRRDIPGTDSLHAPFLSAIHPTDPDLLFVRTNSKLHDTLMVTGDGGQTWATVLEGDANLFGFAMSLDGSTIVAGFGDSRDLGVTVDEAALGIWRAPTSTLAFQRVYIGPIGCLEWTARGLYACTSQSVHGFELGLSTDEGSTLSPLLRLSEIAGSIDCAAGTSAAAECPCAWSALCATLGACPDSGASEGCVDGGDGSAGSSGAGGSAGADASMAGGAPPDGGTGAAGTADAAGRDATAAAGDAHGEGGCACRTRGARANGRDSRTSSSPLGIAVALSVTVRRRRIDTKRA